MIDLNNTNSQTYHLNHLQHNPIPMNPYRKKDDMNLNSTAFKVDKPHFNNVILPKIGRKKTMKPPIHTTHSYKESCQLFKKKELNRRLKKKTLYLGPKKINSSSVKILQREVWFWFAKNSKRERNYKIQANFTSTRNPERTRTSK